jgi:hypothetical protein
MLTFKEANMKKNKLFIFLSIIILILIFGVAATCNLCGVPIDIGEATEASVEYVEEDITTHEQSSQSEQTQGEPVQSENQTEEVAEHEGESEPEEASGVTENYIVFNGDVNKSGTLLQDTGVIDFGNDYIRYGDDYQDKIYKGYLSFDISDISTLEDVTIKDAEIIIDLIEPYEEPWEASDYLNVKVFYYGDTLDYPEDFEEGGALISSVKLDPWPRNFILMSSLLYDELQKAVDNHREDFQLKLGLKTKSNDQEGDYFVSIPSYCELQVVYEIPAP